MTTELLTLGVEEEYQIVDRETLRMVSRSQPILHKALEELGQAVQPERQLSQIETGELTHVVDFVCAETAKGL